MRHIALLVAIALSAGCANAQNLLSNGDFNTPSSTAAPANWTIWTYANTAGNAWANHATDSSSFDGSYYMQVGSSEGITSGAGLYQIVPGLPGYSYTLSVKSGVQAWWWPEGEMRIFFLDSSQNILSESVSDVTTAITANGQGLPWSNFTLTAVSPPGTAYVKVEFSSQSYSENYGIEYAGTVWFDNAVLTNAPSAASYIPPVRIMPLGDSITWGQTAPVSTPGGYRLPLYQLLNGAGFNAQMVGTVWANGAQNLPQQNHEGWQGYRIDQIASSFLTWVNAVPSPDIILLLIGTNDYGQNYDTAHATNRLDQLIELIATNQPNAKLVVSSVLLRTDSASVNTAIQTTFNPYIPGIVASHAARGQQVYFIDLAAVFGASGLGTDGLHPNQTGYGVMGANWYNTVNNLITPLGTTNPPVISTVVGNSNLTKVDVTFSKAVSSSSATNVANYSSDGGLAILSATLDPAGQRDVTLVTSPQLPKHIYTLTCSNVQDITSNHLTIASGTTARFFSAPAGLGPAAVTQVETRADGTGAIVGSQTLAVGSSLTVYAIARDASGNYLSNSAAAWSLVNRTGGVVSGDLLPAGDNKSATFTAHQLGSAVIQAVANGFTGQSGIITASAGPVTQLIWTTQPANATNGMPFGTQPVLVTADPSGAPSTTGLTATQNVVVTLSAGTGPLVGTTNYNIGTSGGNGVVSFSNLEIDSAGAGKQITATARPAYGSPVSGMAVWLDANNAASVLTNASGSVTNWRDLSGNGNHFNTVLGTGTGIAYTNATTVSGRRTVSFPGVGSLMNTTYVNNGNQISIFIVSKYKTSGAALNNVGPMSGTDGVNNDYTGVNNFDLNYQNNNPPTPVYERTAIAKYGNYDPGLAYHTLEGISTGSGNIIYINGGGAVTNTTTIGSFALNHLSIGSRLNGAAGQGYCNNDMAEVLVYNTALSPADRATVETYLSNKWFTTTFSVIPSNAVSVPFSVAAQGIGVTVESKADGSGVVVPLQNLVAGASTNVFAIVRNNGAYVSNAVAAWSLQGITGGVVSGDLAPAGDSKSATFTAHLAGSAMIQAVVFSGTAGTGLSGVQTVVAGAVGQTAVETKADGTGGVVAAQTVSAGSSISLYAIARDAQGNYVNNAAATWSLVSKTGGVVDGDLVTAGDNKSATFTAHQLGSAVIRAVANGFTGQSGTITAGGGPVTQLIWTTQPGNATNSRPFGTQPVLKTADQYGNPSAMGLGATLNVVVTLSAGTGPLVGTTAYNIGTAGSNGVVSCRDLQLNQAGGGNVLTATALPGYGTPVAGAQVWLDASAASTVYTNASGNVTGWADLSGNGHSFYTNTLVTSSGGVWYTNANTPSGRSTITFPGTIGMWCHTYTNLGPNISVMLVTKKRVAGQGNGGQYQGPFGANNGSYSDYNNALGFTMDYGSSENTPLVERGSSFSYGTYEPSTAYHLFEFVGTATGNTLWINGAGGNTGGGTVANFSITNLAVGCRLNAASGSPAWGNQYYDGDLAEVLVYNAALGTADRQSDETYLSNKWLTASFSIVPSNAVSLPFTVYATSSSVQVESTSDGSGGVIPTQNLTAGASMNVFAIVRNGGTFLSNSVATWSLVSKTGGVVDGDLVPAGDNKSATFTAHHVGSAVIQAVASAGTGVSGVQTVVAGVVGQTRVESMADGAGVTVPAQTVAGGSSVSLYAIARDSQGNFLGNVAASWSLVSKTGGVADGDLVVAGDSKSATFTAHQLGSALAQAVANNFTGQSGVLTVNGLGTVTSYEDFNYTPGTSLNGASGGIGWTTNAWGYLLGGTRGFTNAAGSLSDPTGTLLTSGNHVWGDGTITLPTANAYAGRFNAYPANWGSNGSTFYMSVLMRPDTMPAGSSFGLQVYSVGAKDLFCGKGGSNTFWRIESGGAGVGSDSAKPITVGATALLVLRIDFGNPTDTFRLYVNPTPGGAEPATADASVSYDIGYQDGIALQANAGAQVDFDEVRIGTTFAVVTPATAVVVTSPALSISPSGSSTIISWPTNSGAGFSLWFRTSLSAGNNWSSVGTSPTVVGTNYQVTVPASGVAQYFRLSNQ